MEIDKDTPVEEIIAKNPSSVEVFKRFGMEVIICGEVVWDSVGQLCEKYGVDVDIFLAELKKFGI